ncbi:MAG: serine racemase VanT catalytic subunit [Peptococcaceae bacterium]
MIKGTGRAWIELDMNNLHHNLNVVRNRLQDNCQLMASVKADAYGHGAVEICRKLNTLGVRAFCVASVMEGVELRKRQIEGEILILGYTHPEQFPLLVKYGLTQTVLDLDYAELLNGFGEKLVVHIKIDTGLRRLGERSENSDRILRIFACKNLSITGIFTHFRAENDGETGENFTQEQLERFHHVRSEIEKCGFTRPKAHVQNSYGILNRPDLAFDYARIGRALYGTLSDLGGADRYGVELRPVLSLKARVSAVKTVFTGEYVGYGFTFIAPKAMRIAVLTIGYADGLSRSLSCGAGHVLIDGHRAPVLGCICMDQTMVDVTDIEKVERGDTAVVIGKSGGVEISVCDVAEQAGTISTEVLSRLGTRLERVVLGAGK